MIECESTQAKLPQTSLLGCVGTSGARGLKRDKEASPQGAYMGSPGIVLMVKQSDTDSGPMSGESLAQHASVV